MRTLAVLLAALAVPALADPTDAPAPEQKPLVQGKIAVLDLGTSNAPAELAATLTETIATEAATVPGVSVIGKSDIKALLSFEMQKQLLGCSDESCLAEIGGALGVDILISGTLGKVGEVWILNVRLLDAKNSRSLGRREQQVEGGEAQLLAAARNLTSLLLTGKEKITTGFLELVTSVIGATIIVDGKERGLSPLAAAMELGAGPHKIIVRKDGFIPVENAVTIAPAQTAKLDVTLIPVAEIAGGSGLMPWVWTGLGLAAATLAGGLYFGNEADKSFESYDAASTLLDAQKFETETKDNARLANILFAGAAVVGVAAGAMLVVELSADRAGGGGSISIGGSF